MGIPQLKTRMGFALAATSAIVAAWPLYSFASYHLSQLSGNRVNFASPDNLFHPQIPDEMLDKVLADPDHKMGPEFQVPPEIKKTVKFWLRVYTQYSSKNIVFFDTKDMDIIYDELDFNELSKTARNAVVYEIVSENRIKKTMKQYRAAFASLVKQPRPKRPNAIQKKILSALKKHTPNEKLTAKFVRERAENFKFIRGQRDFLMNGLLSAEEFLPKMEMIFSTLNVPKELTRLSLVESSFNLKATSKVGASGVWQFMPGPGKKFLKIDSAIDVDERRSPLKSTIAAAKMLKWNYKYLGSWVLAIISYNHGLRHLPRLKDHSPTFSKIAYLFSNTRGKTSLGWASRSYYCEFLAALYAERYRNLFYGDFPSTLYQNIGYVQLKKKESGLKFAMENKIPLDDFRSLNADIEDVHQTLPRGFWVAVPSPHDDIKSFVSTTIKSRMR